MKITKIRCDICKEDIPYPENKNVLWKYTPEETDRSNEVRLDDVCEACSLSIYNHMKSLEK